MNTLTYRIFLSIFITVMFVSCGAPDEVVTGSAAGANATEENPAATVSTASVNPIIEEDPFIWLEEVEGPDALVWAAEQNALSVPRLQGDPRFDEIRSEIEAILTSDDRIPSGSLVDGNVYNFWQDEEHVRGILRRTSLQSYSQESPNWETVLDIDALAAVEDANWVYKGRSCLPSNPDRCLMQLSDGGKDAVVVREFDLSAKNFVDGGFVIDEAKTNVDWADANTLIVGTDFGEGSMTTSGYARSLRLWHRGSSLAEAEQIIEVDVEDMMVGPTTANVNGEELSLVVRRPDIFTEESWLLTE